MQIRSAPTSRRIIELVAVPVIGLILATFFEIPSGERDGVHVAGELRADSLSSAVRYRFADFGKRLK